MCDLNLIYTLIAIANVALITAIVSCGIAIAMNLGFITAAGAPVAFGIALASGLVASLTLAPATGMLGGCDVPQCVKEAQIARDWFGVITGTLAAGLVLAYIAIALSGVFVAGVAPMTGYGVFLVAAAGMLPQALGNLDALQACLATPAPPIAPFTRVSGIIVAFVGVVTAVLILLLNGRTNRPQPEEPSD